MTTVIPDSTTAIPHLGVRAVRANLTTYLRAAQTGHRIIITIDGLPVAELGPIGGSGGYDDLAGLVAAGLLEPPRRTDRTESPPSAPLPAGMNTERILAELRGR